MTESELELLQYLDPSLTGSNIPATGSSGEGPVYDSSQTGGENSDTQEYDPNAVGLAANNIPAGKPTVDEIMGPFGSGGNPQDFDPSVTGIGAVYAPLSPDAQAQAIKDWNDSYQNMMQDIADSKSMDERRQKVRYYRATGQLDAYKKSGLPVVNDLNYLGASDEDNEGHVALAPEIPLYVDSTADTDNFISRLFTSSRGNEEGTPLAPEAPLYVDSTADTDNPISRWYTGGKQGFSEWLRTQERMNQARENPNASPEEYNKLAQESADAFDTFMTETIKPVIQIASLAFPVARLALIPFMIQDAKKIYKQTGEALEKEGPRQTIESEPMLPVIPTGQMDETVPNPSKEFAGTFNVLSDYSRVGPLAHTIQDQGKLLQDLKDEKEANKKAFELLKIVWELTGGKGKGSAPPSRWLKGTDEIPAKFTDGVNWTKKTSELIGTKDEKKPEGRSAPSIDEIMGPYGSR